MSTPAFTTVREPIEVFGDESCGLTAITYGVVALPQSWRFNLEWRLQESKAAFGGGVSDRIHAADLFNESARSQGPWAHLSRDEVFRFMKRVADESISLRAQHVVARHKRTPGAFEHVSPAISIDGSLAPIDHSVEHFKADKAIAVALAGSAIMALLDALPNHIRFLPDPDGDSRITWPPKRRRVDDLLKSIWYGLGDRAARVEVVSVARPKPPILEIADVLAYVSQKSAMPPSETTSRFAEILEAFQPASFELFGAGTDEERLALGGEAP